MLKRKIAFLCQKLQYFNNLSSIVMPSSCHQPPYEPRLGVVINGVKFRVCMLSNFLQVKMTKHKTASYVALILLKIKILF